MQQYQKPLSHWIASAVLGATNSASWAQSAETPSLVLQGEPLPPRFVLCQREVSSGAGERAGLMRTCLARRLEGERVVQRDCKRQVGAVKGVQARQSAMLVCERQALSVASHHLPRGAAPAPRPAPAVAAEGGRAASPVLPVVTTRTLPTSGEN